MELEEEILARIRAAESLDPTVKPEDFQIRAGENGSVLINLKTGRAQLIYDDESRLHDLEDLSIPATQEEEKERPSVDKKIINLPPKFSNGAHWPRR